MLTITDREQVARERATGKARWKSMKWRVINWNMPARSGTGMIKIELIIVRVSG